MKNIETRTPSEVATEIFNAIINKVKEAKKDVLEIDVEVYENGYGERPFGQDWQKRVQQGKASRTYAIRILGKEYEFEHSRHYNLVWTLDMLKTQIESECTNTIVLMDGGVMSRVLFINPCNDFVKLIKYIYKYAKVSLRPQNLYSVSLFGKRGRYEENGHRNYLAVRPTECKRILAELRAKRGTKDSMTCNLKTNEYKEDEEYSYEHETECYGHKQCGFEVVIATPSGKEKFRQFYYA